MKPEHFIYKSDGLYYIKDMPEKEYYETHGHFDRITASKDGMSAYNEALERAKADAVKVESLDDREAIGYLILLKYNETKEGEIYTINMEEEIEVVYQYHSSRKYYTDATWVDCTEDQYKSILSFGEVRIIARIVVPKKQEESESQDAAIRALFNLFGGAWHHCTDEEEDKIIEAIKEKFEIKRKPL